MRHPVLGESQQVSVAEHCSRCGAQLPEVPLMVFGEGDDAWVFCDACAGPLLIFALPTPER